MFSAVRLPVICLFIAAFVMAAPTVVFAGDDAPPPAARKAQTDMDLPHGFYFDEDAQQYKKRVRTRVQTTDKNGKTQSRRVIQTTCYNLQHETEKSRVFRPVQCRK